MGGLISGTATWLIQRAQAREQRLAYYQLRRQEVWATSKFGRISGQSVVTALPPTKIESHVLQLHVTRFFQSPPEGSDKIIGLTGGPATNPANDWHYLVAREPPRATQPRRRAAI
jgi:hypothetical protein